VGGSRQAEHSVCDDCEVRDLAVCGSLTHPQLPRLAGIMLDRRLDVGQLLFQEGDPAADVFTVTSGLLKLYKLMGDGRRQVTGFLVAGDFLGLAFVRAYAFSAEAVTAASVCRFPRDPFMKLLDDFPALEKTMLARASTELAAAHEQMLLLGRKTARERLATFLVLMARRRPGEHGGVLDLPMSRADIADYLGLTIETVSRTFTQLRKDGMICLPDSHSVVVPNVPRLERLAGA
jgi:CRP/FNR family transcriptional regulator